MNTLKYASRARNIVNRPMVNMDPQEQLIAALKGEVQALRAENLQLRNVIRSVGRDSPFLCFFGDRTALEGGSGGGQRITISTSHHHHHPTKFLSPSRSSGDNIVDITSIRFRDQNSTSCLLDGMGWSHGNYRSENGIPLPSTDSLGDTPSNPWEEEEEEDEVSPCVVVNEIPRAYSSHYSMASCFRSDHHYCGDSLNRTCLQRKSSCTVSNFLEIPQKKSDFSNAPRHVPYVVQWKATGSRKGRRCCKS